MNTFCEFPLEFLNKCLGIWFSQISDSNGAGFVCNVVKEVHTTDYLTKTGFYGRSLYITRDNLNQTNTDVWVLALGY
jgi:hypothetical protein